MKEKALLLLPNLLGEMRHHELFLPQSVDKAVKSLDGLIAESEQGGRRFLSHFELNKKVHEVPIALLNEHTLDGDLDFLLEPIIKGERWGLVSDAGLPCIADPGSKLVAKARQNGISVQAFVGPCSFILALMLSGFSGQKFSFQGYLNKDPKLREVTVRKLEKMAVEESATQIFMEAPYRSVSLFQHLLSLLSDTVQLGIAVDLTLPTQKVMVERVGTWKKIPPPNIEKKPVVFLISK